MSDSESSTGINYADWIGSAKWPPSERFKKPNAAELVTAVQKRCEQLGMRHRLLYKMDYSLMPVASCTLYSYLYLRTHVLIHLNACVSIRARKRETFALAHSAVRRLSPPEYH